MTRIEVLEKIIRQDGGCAGIICTTDKCPLSEKFGNGLCGYNKKNLKLAKEMLEEEKNKEMKEVKYFKVGDKVKWNGMKYCGILDFGEFIENFLKSKKVHTIREISPRKACQLEDSDFWIDFNWLDLVEEEKPKFKVGDKVKWNGNKDYNFVPFYDEKEKFLNSKEVHTISEMSSRNGVCRLEDGDILNYDLKWFDLVEEEEEIIIDFKTGDKVKCKETLDLTYLSQKMLEFLNSKEVHVIKKIGNKFCQLEGSNCLWYCLDLFELVKEEVKENE